jgi:hypothetical protein
MRDVGTTSHALMVCGLTPADFGFVQKLAADGHEGWQQWLDDLRKAKADYEADMHDAAKEGVAESTGKDKFDMAMTLLADSERDTHLPPSVATEGAGTTINVGKVVLRDCWNVPQPEPMPIEGEVIDVTE